MEKAWLTTVGLSIKMDGWQVLDDFKLSLNEGEVLALLGPSGCGKTTFLKILAGLLRPDSGKIYQNGQDITALAPEQRNFGLMFQDYALFPHLSVLDNIAFPLRQKGHNKKEARRLAADYLERFQLQEQENKGPQTLSGGQKQRVALARLLAMQPKLLLLDEPLSAVDSEMKGQIMEELAPVLKEAQGAIYVTHDQAEAQALTGSVALMGEGKLLVKGLWPELWAQPPSPRLACILGYNEVKNQQKDGPYFFVSPFNAHLGPAQKGEMILDCLVIRSYFHPGAVKIMGQGPNGESWRFDLQLDFLPPPGQKLKIAATYISLTPTV